MLQQFATSPAKKVLMRTSNDNYSNCCIVFNVTTPGRRPPTFIPKWDLLQYKLNGNEGRSLLGMQLNLEQNWQHVCCCTAANSMPCSSILGSQFTTFYATETFQHFQLNLETASICVRRLQDFPATLLEKCC